MKKKTVMKITKQTNSNTHMGNVSIDSDVIAQYAGTVATECFGIVGMAGINVKDGLVKLLKLDDMLRKGIKGSKTGGVDMVEKTI